MDAKAEVGRGLVSSMERLSVAEYNTKERSSREVQHLQVWLQ